MTNDDPVSLESNRVCEEHRGSFSKDCTVCKLEAARNEMVLTFRTSASVVRAPTWVVEWPMDRFLRRLLRTKMQ
jgi:hypothetical protein